MPAIKRHQSTVFNLVQDLADIWTSINADRVHFATESLVVSGDLITLTNEPKNAIILNFNTVRHTDANQISFDIPVIPTADPSIYELVPNTPGSYNGKTVTIQYAFTPVV